MILALFDNRAALADPFADPFCPLASNATVAAWLPKQTFPSPGSPEWGRLNRRRADLIRRKVRSGLSPEEDEELEWLQKESLAAVDHAFPRPTADLHSLAELEKRLEEGSS